jgi:hypothetical protein
MKESRIVSRLSRKGNWEVVFPGGLSGQPVLVYQPKTVRLRSRRYD